MEKNPKYPKMIQRDSLNKEELNLSEMKGEVEYTSGWEKVDGAKGVSCRTWKIKDVGAEVVDGADITIESGGYTPIQKVKAVEVVVDAPEEGEAYSVVMDTTDPKSEIYVNHFDGTDKSQMVWTEGMVISWIAVKETRLTEFEKPGFTSDMFANIAEDSEEFQNGQMLKYLEIVKGLRNLVKTS